MLKYTKYVVLYNYVGAELGRVVVTQDMTCLDGIQELWRQTGGNLFIGDTIKIVEEQEDEDRRESS